MTQTVVALRWINLRKATTSLVDRVSLRCAEGSTRACPMLALSGYGQRHL